jgi:hypothetical protein
VIGFVADVRNVERGRVIELLLDLQVVLSNRTVLIVFWHGNDRSVRQVDGVDRTWSKGRYGKSSGCSGCIVRNGWALTCEGDAIAVGRGVLIDSIEARLVGELVADTPTVEEVEDTVTATE